MQTKLSYRFRYGSYDNTIENEAHLRYIVVDGRVKCHYYYNIVAFQNI